MPITDIREPLSPGWWLKRCADKLLARQPRVQGLIDRLEGNGPLPQVNDNVREAYKAFQRKARTNWAELIVEAVRERMVCTGFRTGAEAGEAGDDEALRIAQGSGLTVELADVLQMMLATGDGYMIVGFDDIRRLPIITGEDPRQVVTIHDPVQQRTVRAALKMFHDPEESRDYAYLYRPGRVHVATRKVRRLTKNQAVTFSPSSWNWDDDRGGPEGEAVPGNVVPVVRFRNRRGVGEYELHTDLLDRIDHMVLQRLVIATFQAFKQRAIKGLPDEDEDGEEIDYDAILSSDPGAWYKVGADVEFWESGTVDLTPLLSGSKDDLRSLAAVTRTALSYLAPDMAAGSAEGASLMREGQIFRTEDRIARASESLKDVMSLAFLFAGDEKRADRSRLQPLWASPERLSMAERGDAATKAQDMPRRDRLIRIWGVAPDEADRMLADLAADALLTAPAPAIAPPAPLAIPATT